MKAAVITSDITVERVSDGLLVTDLLKQETFRLNDLTAAVFETADGSRSVRELAAETGARLGRAVTHEEIWQALDVLADAGLLTERVAPPAGDQTLTRRDLMRRVAVAGVAVGGITLASGRARAQDRSPGTEEETGGGGNGERQAEQGQKRAEEQYSKASERLRERRFKARDRARERHHKGRDASGPGNAEQTVKNSAADERAEEHVSKAYESFQEADHKRTVSAEKARKAQAERRVSEAARKRDVRARERRRKR